MSGSKSLRDKISKTVADIPRSGIRDFFDIVSTRHDIISLGIGEPDFDTPWHIREAGIFSMEKGATHYTANLGLMKLRRALAQYVDSFFGISYDPAKEVLVTVGVSEAMDLAVRAVINPGEEVLYHEPCFVSYAPIVSLAQGVPVPIRLGQEQDFVLTRALLEEHVSERSKVLILNYPNNPTGAVIPRKELQGISELVVERDLLVISDEIYAELTYEGEHCSIATFPGMKERTIFLHGFSKSWAMTGFRMGYACAPHELTEAMMKIHQYTMMSAPTPSQEAALEALARPDDDIPPMRDEYRRRRNYIANAFKDMGLPCSYPRGAFYAFPYIGDLGVSSHDFAMRFLEEEDVAVVPGTAFGSCGEGYVRCSYATAMDDIKEAMVRFERFIGRLKS
jgi:aminotransferase